MLCWKLLSSFRQNNSRKWHRSRITTTTDVVSDRQFCERHECIGRCLDERVSVWLHVCIARWLEVCGGVALRMHRENNGWMPVSMWHCVCVDRWLGVQYMCRCGMMSGRMCQWDYLYRYMAGCMFQWDYYLYRHMAGYYVLSWHYVCINRWLDIHVYMYVSAWHYICIGRWLGVHESSRLPVWHCIGIHVSVYSISKLNGWIHAHLCRSLPLSLEPRRGSHCPFYLPPTRHRLYNDGATNWQQARQTLTLVPFSWSTCARYCAHSEEQVRWCSLHSPFPSEDNGWRSPA